MKNIVGEDTVESLGLIKYLVIVEIYTLAQLRGLYEQTAGDDYRVLRSIDIKNSSKRNLTTKSYFANQVIIVVVIQRSVYY